MGLGQGVGERVAEVQHSAVAHAAAKLDARPQRQPCFGYIDRN